MSREVPLPLRVDASGVEESQMFHVEPFAVWQRRLVERRGSLATGLEESIGNVCMDWRAGVAVQPRLLTIRFGAGPSAAQS